jgi:hypothetical protein
VPQAVISICQKIKIAKGVFNVATNLVVRNVEEDIALALQQVAASHG